MIQYILYLKYVLYVVQLFLAKMFIKNYEKLLL